MARAVTWHETGESASPGLQFKLPQKRKTWESKFKSATEARDIEKHVQPQQKNSLTEDRHGGVRQSKSKKQTNFSLQAREKQTRERAEQKPQREKGYSQFLIFIQIRFNRRQHLTDDHGWQVRRGTIALRQTFLHRPRRDARNHRSQAVHEFHPQRRRVQALPPHSSQIAIMAASAPLAMPPWISPRCAAS